MAAKSEERVELWKRVAADEARTCMNGKSRSKRDSNAGKLDHLLAKLKDDIKSESSEAVAKTR